MKISLFDNYIWKARHADYNIYNEVRSLVSDITTSKDLTVRSHISDEVVDTSVIHGSHDGMYGLQLFSKYEDTISNFIDFVDNEICNYILSCNWKLHDHEYIHSWINMTSNGTAQEWHTHANSHISGVYYHNTVIEHGGIIFKNPNPYVHMNLFPGNNPGIHFHPEPNTLFLFPSWMEHKTDKNRSDSQRISIAFNVLTRH